MESSLKLVAGYKEQKSYVKDLFVSLPFRVVSVGQRKNDDKLYQMIMSSSPGILDGDRYNIDIRLESGASLCLESQSYQRLFDMKNSATQTTNIKLADDTSFSFVPHPIVPHKNSNFRSKTVVYMGKNTNLVLGEIVTCGRKHYGECFLLNRFQNVTEIFHHNKLVVKDNFIICPESIPINVIGNLEQYTHQGTLIYYTTKTVIIEEILEKIYHLIDFEKDSVEVGLSRLDSGIIVRSLGHSGENLYDFFRKIQKFIWEL